MTAGARAVTPPPTGSHEGTDFVESGERRVLVALQGKDTYTPGTFRLDVR